MCYDRQGVSRSQGGPSATFIDALEPRRFLSAGDLDIFYGDGGITSIRISQQSTAATTSRAVAALPDGRAYVAGGGGLLDMSLARVTFDGAPDPTFGNGGVVVTDIQAAQNEIAQAIVVQPDGKVLVAANFTAPSQTGNIAVVRYNTNGTVDHTFAANGTATIDFGGHDEVRGLLLQPDGKPVVLAGAGNGNRELCAVMRLNADGTPDTTFGTSGGKYVFEFATEFGRIGSRIHAGLVLDDGKILLTGSADWDGNWGTDKLTLARLASTGQLDATFGTGGLQKYDTAGMMGSDVARAPGGGYFVSVATANAVTLRKFTAAGTVDATWGTGGSTQVFTDGDDENVQEDAAVAVQSDGSILVSAGHRVGWILARVLADGQQDMTFGGTGVARKWLGTVTSGGGAMALQPDGRALIVGGATAYPTPILDGLVLARYQTQPDRPPGALLDAGTRIVTLVGDAAPNAAAVSVDVSSGRLITSVDAVTHDFAMADLDRIDIRLGAGVDTLSLGPGVPRGMIDLARGDDALVMAGLAPGAPRKVFGGDGNDAIELRTGAGAHVDLDGGAGSDTIVLAGSAADETLTLAGNTATGFGYTAAYTATESLRANPGAGNDTVTLNATLRAAATVDGGDGDDVFDLLPFERDFYGNIVGFISSLRGGQGSDTLRYTGSPLGDTLTLTPATLTHGVQTAATISELEEVTLFGADGNDTLVADQDDTIHLTADGGAHVDQLRYNGTGSPDTIDVTVANVTGGGKSADYSAMESLSISTLGGNDLVTLSGMPSGPGVTVSGGAGDDTLTIAAIPAAPVSFVGGSSTTVDTLNVHAGTYTFNTDANFGTTRVQVNVANAGSAVVFNARQHLAGLALSAGTTATMAPTSPNPQFGTGYLHTRGLSIDASAKLDLNDNDLIWDYADASPYAVARQFVINGRSNPGGAGGIVVTPGATSDDRALAVVDNAIFGRTSWLGQAIDATTLIGKYTYFGDANLDGRVTGDDYLAIDANLGTSPGSRQWFHGDFNFDGAVTGDDYLAIDANLGKGTPTPLAYAEEQADMIALHAEQFGGKRYIKQVEGMIASTKRKPGGGTKTNSAFGATR